VKPRPVAVPIATPFSYIIYAVTEQFAATAAGFQPSVVLLLVVAEAFNPPGTPGAVEQAAMPLGLMGCHRARVMAGSHPIWEV
jgi:hypothetical protein